MVRRNDTMRFSRSSSRTMTEARMRGSILPPQRISPTLRPTKRRGSASIAASPAAPAPSAIVFCKVRNALTARSINGSSTRISLTSSRITGSALAGIGDRDAFGKRSAAASAVALVDRVPHRRIERAFDADDLDARAFCSSRGDGAAGDQAAAADRETTRVSRPGSSSSISSARGALAGDDLRTRRKGGPRPNCCSASRSSRRASLRLASVLTVKDWTVAPCACVAFHLFTNGVVTLASRSLPVYSGGARDRQRLARDCRPTWR